MNCTPQGHVISLYLSSCLNSVILTPPTLEWLVLLLTSLCLPSHTFLPHGFVPSLYKWHWKLPFLPHFFTKAFNVLEIKKIYIEKGGHTEIKSPGIMPLTDNYC